MRFPGLCLPSSYSCSSSGFPENMKQSEDGVQEFQSISVRELKAKASASWMHSTLRLNNECTQSPMVGVRHNVPFVLELISTTSSQPEATQALSETVISTRTVEAQWGPLCTGRVRRRLGVPAVRAPIYGYRSTPVLRQTGKLSSQTCTPPATELYIHSSYPNS